MRRLVANFSASDENTNVATSKVHSTRLKVQGHGLGAVFYGAPSRETTNTYTSCSRLQRELADETVSYTNHSTRGFS